MRDRLIELLKKEQEARCKYTREKIQEMLQGNLRECLRTGFEFSADYLLENGVIVPPCKVGDIVKHDTIYYKVYRAMTYSDFETPIHHRYWAEPINEEGEDDFWFWDDRVKDGTVVVCSKEEAMQALKGGAENG